MDQPADTTPPTTVQKLAAEGLGTAVLVLVGCGSLTYTSDSSALGSALAFGLVLVGLGLAFARISGGHFNPVISLGSALAGRIAWAEAGLMAAAQLVGGIVGGAVLLVLMKGNTGFDAFTTPIGPSIWGDKTTGYHWWAAILLELVLSAVLVMVALGATDRRNGNAAIAPIVIGLTFAGLYLISLPAVGGGINPARSIGADLFSGSDAIKGVWVFIVGPLLGVVVGGFGYPLLFGRDGEQVPGSGLNFGGGSSSKAPAYPGYQQPWGGQPGQPGQAGQPGQQAAPGGYAGGYGAPAQQGTPVGQAGQGGQSAPQAEQPIIQDGWQWDPQAQQWIPAQQQPGGWAPSGGESTQIRPPEGS